MEYKDRHQLKEILKIIKAPEFTDDQLAVLICSTRPEGACCNGCSGDCFGHDVIEEIKEIVEIEESLKIENHDTESNGFGALAD